MLKFFNLKIFILFLYINIKIINSEIDECLYAIQREKNCFQIPMNGYNESCCYLEMDLNQITTTACIRVKNNEKDIEKRIFEIRQNEEDYSLEHLNVKCNSYYTNFSILIFIIIFIK